MADEAKRSLSTTTCSTRVIWARAGTAGRQNTVARRKALERRDMPGYLY
jgi:hypothetical protein